MGKFSSQLFEALRDCLEDNRIIYAGDEDSGEIKFVLCGLKLCEKINGRILVRNDGYLIRLFLPLNTELLNEENMDMLREYILRCNFEDERALFQLDQEEKKLYADQSVCTKSYIPTVGEISMDFLELTNFLTDNGAVIFRVSQEAALEKCEHLLSQRYENEEKNLSGPAMEARMNAFFTRK